MIAAASVKDDRFLGFPHPNNQKVTSMFSFTPQQRFTALCWLSLFHILIITSSNYLVQLPITVFGFHTTQAPLPSVYLLATDLTVRIFGARWPGVLFWR